MQKEIQTAVVSVLTELGIGQIDFVVEHPGDLSHGDYACNVAMVAAKTLGRNPRELAEEIAAKLEGKIEYVEKLEVAGPGFINFHLSRDFFSEKITQIQSQGDAWGKNDDLAGQTWVIEHTSPNPNKAMHIGHLRNNVVGMALVHLAEANGATVIADEIDNNRGIAIAKLMWGYLRFARRDGDNQKTLEDWYKNQDEWHTPESAGVSADRFVDDLYVKGNTDFEASQENEQAVRDLVVAWEAGGEKVRELWKRVLQYSHEGQAKTLERLGSRFDHVWHEHEHYQAGKDLVQAGLDKGIFKELPEGGMLTQLEQYGLSDTILQKSDGTSLYVTQDIALTKLKKEKYHAKKLIWVIGPDQSLAMQQLFAVCEQLGIGTREEFEHVAYGYMSIKGVGKMSSRKGTVLYIDDVIDSTAEAVRENMAADMVSDSDLVEDIALAAVKYVILRSGRLRDIAFDQEQATKFEGDSGPYLQYTHARICSVLEKAAAAGVKPDTAVAPATPYTVEKLIYQFPEVIKEALREREPHKVVGFLTQLAGEFNTFYAQEKIADPADEFAPYKAAIADSVRQTLKNGLWVLGIKAPKEM